MKDEERQAYEHHQKQLHHDASLYESTYVLGKIEGKKETLLITAQKMKQAGIDNKTIVEITGLTVAQIELL